MNKGTDSVAEVADHLSILADHISHLKIFGGYVVGAQFDMTADYPLSIEFVDAGGNWHGIQYNRVGRASVKKGGC